MCILVGAVLVAVGLFLPWISGDLGRNFTVEHSAWDSARVGWPIVIGAAATVVALIAPVERLRDPVALLVGGFTGGIGYSWWSSIDTSPAFRVEYGVWVTMAGAVVLVAASLVALMTTPRAP